MSGKTIQFDVQGIHCEGCVEKIRQGLMTKGLAEKVEADVATGKITVLSAEKSSPIALKGQIEKLGYKVSKFEIK